MVSFADRVPLRPATVNGNTRLKSYVAYLHYLPANTDPSLVPQQKHPCIPEVTHGRIAVLIACGSYPASEDRAVSVKANLALVGRAAAALIGLNGVQVHLPFLLLAAGAYDCKVAVQKGIEVGLIAAFFGLQDALVQFV